MKTEHRTSKGLIEATCNDKQRSNDTDNHNLEAFIITARQRGRREERHPMADKHLGTGFMA